MVTAGPPAGSGKKPALGGMRLFPPERSADITALIDRVLTSFLGRCVLRFVAMEGFDRCIVISSQVFTALIPLFIVVASAAPAGQEDVISRAIINRFALSGDSAAAVEQLFNAPAGAATSVGIFSALLLLYSGVAFTRRMQRMYRAAWGQEKFGIRSTVYALLGLVALITEIVVASGVRSLFSSFPLDWLWAVAVSGITGLVLWTSIPYLLLDRHVHWRRLLATGGTAAVAMTIFAIATPIYMPRLMTEYTNEFGLFGITITLIGWLLVAAFILVAAAAIGAEFDASDARWTLRVKVRFRLLDPAHEVPTVLPGRDPRGLNADDVRALIRVMINWLIMTGAVWVATAIVPGIDVQGGFATYLFVSLLLGLVNAVLGPLLHWLAGYRAWIGVTGSALVVNSILLAVTALFIEKMEIDGVGSALLGALVIAVAGTVLTLVLRPITNLSESPGDPARESPGAGDGGRDGDLHAS